MYRKHLKNARATTKTMCRCHSHYYADKINDNCYAYSTTANNINNDNIEDLQCVEGEAFAFGYSPASLLLSPVPSLHMITLKSRAQICM
ncbi:hypothetical protein ACFX19_032673 [Malus domestica]